MMIRVRLTFLSAFNVPTSYLAPRVPAVFRAMKIDSAADHIIRVGWMHNNCVAVGNLAFVSEVRSVNWPPQIAAIRAAIDSEQQIFVAACFVLRKGVKHL